MRLYLMPASFNGSDTIELTGNESQYLVRVLRLKVGQHITGRDATGNLWDLTIEATTKNSCILSCRSLQDGTDAQTTDTLPQYTTKLPPIFLLQGLLKGKKMQMVVRQATEIGACSIIPFQSRFCVVDVSSKKASAVEEKTERLDAMVKEAIQQSGSRVPTTIEEPMQLSAIPSWWNNRGLGLFFHQVDTGEQDQLTDIVRSYVAEHGPDAPVAIMVGPEGGFSDDEVGLLMEAGFKPVLLKTNILRAETAAIYALAVVQSLMTEHCSQ